MQGTVAVETIAEPMTTAWNDVIRRHREVRGLTRKQLADLIGMSEPTIEKWEMSGTKPERPHAEKLDKELGADGAILAACGYWHPQDWGAEIATLRDQLALVNQQIRDLRGVVDDLRRRLP